MDEFCKNCEMVPSELRCIQCNEAKEEDYHFCISCSELHVRMKKFKQHVFEAFIRRVCCNCEHYQMATHRCLDCKDGEQYLCQSCSSFHNKIKNQKDHRVVEQNVSAVAVDDKIEKQEIPTAAAIDSATPPSERLKIMSHSVDEASNKPELARKENELFGKREVLDVEYEVFEIQQSGMEQKMCELEEDTKRERDNHERRRHDVKIEVFKSKKTLKEVGKMWIREEANLERLFLGSMTPPPSLKIGNKGQLAIAAAIAFEERKKSASDTPASSEESKETKRRSEPTQSGDMDEDAAFDMDEDVTDAAAALSTTATSRKKKKKNKKKSTKGDAQPDASTDKPSESIAATTAPSVQPSGAKEIASKSDSNEAISSLLQKEEVTTAASTSTNPPKSTSTPTTHKPSPTPAASASPPPAFLPLRKVILKPVWEGSPTIRARDFCDACRDLEQAKTKGREIVPYFPRGLVNTGNACYRNAVLQSLLASPPLIRMLSALSDNAGRMPFTLTVWREVLSLSAELAIEPLPPLYTPSNASFTGSGQTGRANQRTYAPAVDPLTPNDYFVTTFVDFRKFMVLRREVLPREEGPRSGSTGVVHHRIPQEDAMEFMMYLLQRLNEEMTGMDQESEYSAFKKEENNSGWESVSTTKMKTKLENVVDDKSRIHVARQNAATAISRIFYGTLRSTVCCPANNKASAKIVNSATFQQFFSLKLEITKPMELAGNKDAMKSLPINNPPQYCSLPPLSLDRALECYFQSTALDEGGKETRQIEHLPQVLILQLDRFYIDRNRNVPNKIDRDIRYPMSLVLPNNMLTAELIERLWAEDAVSKRDQETGQFNAKGVIYPKGASYSLVAVVCHQGATTATSGHYTALCRDNSPMALFAATNVGAGAGAGPTSVAPTASARAAFASASTASSDTPAAVQPEMASLLLSSSSSSSSSLTDPPDHLKCSISNDLMVEPVVASDGHTYERSCIEEWIQSKTKKGACATSPITGLPITDRLIPNQSIKILVQEWKFELEKKLPSVAEKTAAGGGSGTAKGTSVGGTGGSKWGWEYDDEKVTPISADDALQATQTAYILLYCRD